MVEFKNLDFLMFSVYDINLLVVKFENMELIDFVIVLLNLVLEIDFLSIFE